MLVEKQLNRSNSKPGNQFHSGLRSAQQFPNFSKAGMSPNSGHTGGSVAGQQSQSSKPSQVQPTTSVWKVRNPSQGGGFKCFKCREPGHKSSDCRKATGNRNKALLIEELLEQSSEDKIPYCEKSLNEEIGGAVDRKSVV